jgi:endonuclease/exonuclease/phosphatase family metal-dependent hydrolase
VRILSCNIRKADADDGPNGWEHRRDLAARILRERDAGVISFQEMREIQKRDLLAALPGYAAHGLTKTARDRHPVNAVFYRTDRFVLVSAGGYWLSDRPHVPGSTAWETASVRNASWVRLIEKETGREFRVVNTHLDHVSALARRWGAEILNADARGYGEDYPQLLTGDLNVDAADPLLAAFAAAGWQDTYATVHGTDDPGPTAHGFEGPAREAAQGRIDWILARGPVMTRGAAIVDEGEDGRYPSDHYFVQADIELL